MRGLFLAGCSLLLLAGGCSGATSQGSGGAGSSGAGAGSVGGAATAGAPSSSAGTKASGGAPGGAGSATAGEMSEAGAGDTPPLGEGGAGGGGGACSCVAQELAWWRDGGLVAYTSVNRVAPCADYTFVEESNANAPSKDCVATELDCSDDLGVDDLNAALQDADVQAALTAAPILYGSDPRVLDGQVYHIEIGGKVIEIGNPCDQGPKCQIPAGVAALGELLKSLTNQEMVESICDPK